MLWGAWNCKTPVVPTWLAPAPCPRTLPWCIPHRGFKQEAERWGQQTALSLTGAATLDLPSVFYAWEEAGVYPIWDLHLSPVLDTLWDSGQLGAQLAVGKVPEGAAFKGNPDRVILKGSEVLVPIELKHSRALPPGGAPLYLLQLVTGSKEKSAEQKHIEQIFGYLTNNGEASPPLRP